MLVPLLTHRSRYHQCLDAGGAAIWRGARVVGILKLRCAREETAAVMQQQTRAPDPSNTTDRSRH